MRHGKKMRHAAPGRNSCLKYCKVLFLAQSFLFVAYFSLFQISNYGNDNTPYSAKRELMNVLTLTRLGEEDSRFDPLWFFQKCIF